MRKTKLIALLLAVAMIASMVVFPSVAAEDPYTISIVDKTTGEATINANAGDKINLYVTVSNNTGVSCVAFGINGPEGWTLATKDAALFYGTGADQTTSLVYQPGSNYDYHLWLMQVGTNGDSFEDIPGGKLLCQNGNLLQIQYTIPADAATGTYTISLEIDPANNFYYNVDSDGVIIPNGGNTKLTPATQDLTINVTGNEPAGAACPCTTCEGTVPEWQAWDGTTTLTSDHYYLQPAEGSDTVTLTEAITIGKGVNVVLDLNGYTLQAPAADRAFYISSSGSLTIMDTSGNDSGKIVGGDTGTAGHGGVIYVYGTSSRFYMYGGTIQGGKVSGGNYVGGNLCVAQGKAYLYGGVICDGYSAYRGGNIGGTNTGETHLLGDIRILDGKADGVGGNAYYGNGPKLYIADNARVSGGKTGGTNTDGGGNIHVLEGSVYIFGGTVEGVAKDSVGRNDIYGGSGASYPAYIYVYGGTVGKMGVSGSVSSITMYNGVINEDPTSINRDKSSALAACTCAVEDNGTYTVWHTGVDKNGTVCTANNCDYIKNLSSVAEADRKTGKHTYGATDVAGKVSCVSCGTPLLGVVALLNGTPYTDLSDALAAAVSGDTVTLVTDTEETDDVIVNSGVTLELCGYTLTADEVSAASTGAHVVDSIGSAKLVTEKLHASFMGSNNQLPIYNDGAYTFENVTIKEKLTPAETTATYKFYVDSKEAQTLLDDAILAGSDVSIDVYVTWKDAAGKGRYKTFTLDTEKLQEYAGAWDAKMIVLTITGIEDITELDCTARVVSGGVTVEP